MSNEVIQVVSSPSWVEIGILIVTTLYLIATVCVFLANRRMAKAAEDQLKAATTVATMARKTELFEKRQKVYDLLTDFIERLLPDWDCDLIKDKMFFDYSETHIRALFDDEVLEFWELLRKKSDDITILHGDFNHASNKGDCRGRNCETILQEIDAIYNSISESFKLIQGVIFDRYLKV